MKTHRPRLGNSAGLKCFRKLPVNDTGSKFKHLFHLHFYRPHTDLFQQPYLGLGLKRVSNTSQCPYALYTEPLAVTERKCFCITRYSISLWQVNGNNWIITLSESKPTFVLHIAYKSNPDLWVFCVVLCSFLKNPSPPSQLLMIHRMFQTIARRSQRFHGSFQVQYVLFAEQPWFFLFTKPAAP